MDGQGCSRLAADDGGRILDRLAGLEALSNGSGALYSQRGLTHLTTTFRCRAFAPADRLHNTFGVQATRLLDSQGCKERATLGPLCMRSINAEGVVYSSAPFVYAARLLLWRLSFNTARFSKTAWTGDHTTGADLRGQASLR